MSDQYAVTYCVACRQKTPWNGQPTLKQTRNCKSGLRGQCCRCSKTKFTFVTTCYYRSKQFELATQQNNAALSSTTVNRSSDCDNNTNCN